jgi:hypothetical protein
MNVLKNRWIWCIAILTALAGCLPSLNPVFRDQDLVFDPGVVGVWKQSGARDQWDFSKFGDKSYRLVYSDQDGHPGRFIARIADLGGIRFLDLFPEEMNADTNAFYKFHQVPIHTIYRIRTSDNKLQLAAIDYKWLEQILAEHPDAISCATFGGRKLITAPTEELQAFVLRHQDKFTATFDLVRELQAAN